MKRWVQGLFIVFGSAAATVLVLAAALAWGPHQCKAAFPMVIGCAFGSYESLAGGMVAAGAALFAGWLAWSAVQIQVDAEAKRAAADRDEVEAVLQGDLDYFAEGLSSVWKILLTIDAQPQPADIRMQLEGLIYGIEKIVSDVWLSTSRKMVSALGWERRRRYEEFFDALDRLGQYRDIDTFDVAGALDAVRRLSDYFEMLRPDTEKYFRGLWRRSPKAWSLGYAIGVQAGLYHIERAAD